MQKDIRVCEHTHVYGPAKGSMLPISFSTPCSFSLNNVSLESITYQVTMVSGIPFCIIAQLNQTDGNLANFLAQAFVYVHYYYG